MPEPTLVNLTINGIAVQAPKGEKIIEAARRAGVDIPFFCYHKRLSMESGANCRMCLVEVAMPRRNPDGTTSLAKFPKPQTACSLPADEGMVIETETEQIVKDRRGVLEFLLINHPLDCPVCDRGGECPLQNNVMHYGPPTSQYIEAKRHFPKAYPLSDHVVYDGERCIHCARCTRFTEDISGDAQLAFRFRGADARIGTFDDTPLTSRFSGNVIELCPVGALTSRDYRFKARPWDLHTQKSICTQCSNGCNIKLDYRASQLERVNARENDAVNEEWTCDRGKFGMGYVSAPDRLQRPLIRRDGKFREATWDEALGLVAEMLREAGADSGAIAGGRCSNEDLYAVQRLYREVLGSGNLDHRMGPAFLPASGGLFAKVGYHTMGNAIADLERMKAILVFGSELADEQPILFLRLRKAWRVSGTAIVEATTRAAGSPATPVSEIASARLHCQPGGEVALAKGLAAALKGQAVEAGGVSAESIRRAADLLAAGEMAIIGGDGVWRSPDAAALVDALADLAIAAGCPGNVNLPVSQANAQGAMDLGFLPDALPGYAPAERVGLDTARMLAASAEGNLKALWLIGADVANEYHDAEAARAGLENCPFLVVSDYALSDTAKMADVVLPLATVAETDGTFTNCERRVQRFLKAFEIEPGILPAWGVASRIALRLGTAMPYYSSRDVLRDIAANVPTYAGCGPRELGELGVRWEYATSDKGAPGQP